MTRLIDADALKKAFKKSPFVNEVHLYYARQLISLAPTVERPHGEWIVTDKKNVLGGFEIQCSCCLTKLIVSRGRYEVGENYCDVCGAKMKKPWVGDDNG